MLYIGSEFDDEININDDNYFIQMINNKNIYNKFVLKTYSYWSSLNKEIQI